MTGEEEYQIAEAEKADRWVPGCGGTEKPFLYNGTRYLWAWNPALGQHSYYNVDTDMLEPYPPFLD